MLADRLMAELRVEGGYAGDLRWSDLSDITDAPQGFLGEVAVVMLEGLEDRNDRLGLSSYLLNESVNRR